MSSIDILGGGANVVGPFKDHLAQTTVAFIPPTVLTFFRFLLLDSFYINYELSQNPRAQYVPSFMNASWNPARDIVHSRIVLHQQLSLMVARREGTENIRSRAS